MKEPYFFFISVCEITNVTVHSLGESKTPSHKKRKNK